MKVLVVSNSGITIRDVHFCLQVRWPDIVMLSAQDPDKGLDMIETEAPDLVVVTSNLPGTDMADLITSIRQFSHVPLIVLAEQQNEMDKVLCLEAGADDCINTPFSPIELLTKVRVLLRRTWGLGFNFREEQPLSVGRGLTINASTREVTVANKRIKLTPTEYRILLELAKNQGRIVTHEMLLERAWGSEYINDTGFVKRYVYRLRQKLETNDSEPLILSERGIGYRLLRQS